jgi:hypothetical protein
MSYMRNFTFSPFTFPILATFARSTVLFIDLRVELGTKGPNCRVSSIQNNTDTRAKRKRL